MKLAERWAPCGQAESPGLRVGLTILPCLLGKDVTEVKGAFTDRKTLCGVLSLFQLPWCP